MAANFLDIQGCSRVFNSNKNFAKNSTVYRVIPLSKDVF